MGEDLIRHTRESIAREYQLAKYYAGNGRSWGANGGWETLKRDDRSRLGGVSEFCGAATSWLEGRGFCLFRLPSPPVAPAVIPTKHLLNRDIEDRRL